MGKTLIFPDSFSIIYVGEIVAEVGIVAEKKENHLPSDPSFTHFKKQCGFLYVDLCLMYDIIM